MCDAVTHNRDLNIVCNADLMDFFVHGLLWVLQFGIDFSPALLKNIIESEVIFSAICAKSVVRIVRSECLCRFVKTEVFALQNHKGN